MHAVELTLISVVYAKMVLLKVWPNTAFYAATISQLARPVTAYNHVTLIGSPVIHENLPTNWPNFATSPALLGWPARNRHTAACIHRFSHILRWPPEPVVWFMSESRAVANEHEGYKRTLSIISSSFWMAVGVKGLTNPLRHTKLIWTSCLEMLWCSLWLCWSEFAHCFSCMDSGYVPGTLIRCTLVYVVVCWCTWSVVHRYTLYVWYVNVV